MFIFNFVFQVSIILVWAVFLIPWGPGLCRVQDHFSWTAVRICIWWFYCQDVSFLASRTVNTDHRSLDLQWHHPQANLHQNVPRVYNWWHHTRRRDEERRKLWGIPWAAFSNKSNQCWENKRGWAFQWFFAYIGGDKDEKELCMWSWALDVLLKKRVIFVPQKCQKM